MSTTLRHLLNQQIEKNILTQEPFLISLTFQQWLLLDGFYCHLSSQKKCDTLNYMV